MAQSTTDLMRSWLARQLPEEQLAWLDEHLGRLSASPSKQDLQLAFGLVPRKIGRRDLKLDDEDIRAAAEARQGWKPGQWSVDNAARVLLLATAAPALNAFSEQFASLCRYGDVAEQIACYSALPLLPQPDMLKPQVGEGLRTNMRAVFEAIAHDNPYPAERFEDHRWNHMVLKALFIGSELNPIYGLDQRANPELARILCDYAHERWAAHRAVSPELWRCVGPFAEGAMVDDLRRAATSNEREVRAAAALALSASPDPRALTVLDKLPRERAAIDAGVLTWASVGWASVASGPDHADNG